MGVSTGGPGTGWDSEHSSLGSEQHYGCGWGQLRVFPDRTQECGYLGRTPLTPTSQWPALILELQLSQPPGVKSLRIWEQKIHEELHIPPTHTPCLSPKQSQRKTSNPIVKGPLPGFISPNPFRSQLRKSVGSVPPRSFPNPL